MKTAYKAFVEGALSGICIGLGGGVWLSVMGESRIAGAVLFSVALLTICYFGFNLYTGRIGFIAFDHKKSDFISLFLGLFGNAAGALLMGVITSAGLKKISDVAKTSVEAKLSQTPVETLIRGFMCGLLMFIAVWIFKKKNTPIGILFAIPVFILSGYEHSIADMYYCFADGVWSADQAAFIGLAVAGNTLGGLTIPLLMKAAGCAAETPAPQGQDEKNDRNKNKNGGRYYNHPKKPNQNAQNAQNNQNRQNSQNKQNGQNSQNSQNRDPQQNKNSQNRSGGNANGKADQLHGPRVQQQKKDDKKAEAPRQAPKSAPVGKVERRS